MEIPENIVITKPPLTRLARRAGIKSISKECYSHIRALIEEKLNNIIEKAIIVKSGSMLTNKDIYMALRMLGENVCESESLEDRTIV